MKFRSKTQFTIRLNILFSSSCIFRNFSIDSFLLKTLFVLAGVSHSCLKSIVSTVRYLKDDCSCKRKVASLSRNSHSITCFWNFRLSCIYDVMKTKSRIINVRLPCKQERFFSQIPHFTAL